MGIKDITNIKGIKDETTISLLPGIDEGTCFVPEEMHSVFLGCVKQLTNIWIISPQKNDYSLEAVIEDLDKFLLEVNPPSCFHRYPRTLTQFCKYKAFEYYVWLLYYSAPILINFLPKKYFQHFMLLLFGIYLLSKEQVSKEDVNLADKSLEAFVDDIEILYSARNCAYNMHQ